MAEKIGILAKVKGVVRRHVNWLVASILGSEAVSTEELKELKKSKLGAPILEFMRRAYMLGKLNGKTKTKAQKKLTTDDLDKFANSYKLTPLDELALSYSQTKAAAYVNSLAGDMTASILSRMSKALGESMSVAAASTIKNEVDAALKENKQLKEFSASLASKLQIDYKDRLVVIAATELHSARIQGLVQSIIQKQEVYKYGDGIESMVSIVPKPGTCPDCAKHYLDAKGNPKVHKLSSLISMGSNADPGTKHSKRNNIHTHWKTTLPALHPSCQCEVIFVPTGFAWVAGGLKLVDPVKFQKSIDLYKAEGTMPARPKAIGQKSNLGPTNVPKGAPQSNAPAKPGNIPGVAAPSAAPSASPSGTADTIKAPSDSSGSAGAGKEYYYAQPGDDTSGPGWESYKKRDGGMGMRKEVGAGGSGSADENSLEELNSLVEASKAYGSLEHTHRELSEKLKAANITTEKPIDEEEGAAKGVTEAGIVVSLQDGPRAVMKPKTLHSGVANGSGAIVQGQGVYSERAVHSVATLFGLNNVQHTELREHNNQVHSIQLWKEGSTTLGTSIDEAKKENPYITLRGHLANAVYESSTEEITYFQAQERAEEITNNMATLSIVAHLGDQHANNIMFDGKSGELQAIDNSVSFGTGVASVGSTIMRDSLFRGNKVQVPEALKNKLVKTSFNDIQKAMPDMLPWQHAQTKLRGDYVASLQDAEGHLDPEKFVPTLYQDPMGQHTSMLDDPIPFSPYWSRDANTAQAMFEERKDDHTLPDELFQLHMAHYFNDRREDLNDESSEAHQMLKTAPFIDPGMELFNRSDKYSDTPTVSEQLSRVDTILEQYNNKKPHEVFKSRRVREQERANRAAELSAAVSNNGEDEPEF